MKRQEEEKCEIRVDCLSELDEIFNSDEMLGFMCDTPHGEECNLCPFLGTSYYCSPKLRGDKFSKFIKFFL